MRASVFSPGFRRQLQGYHAREILARHMNAADTDDQLSRIQYADLKTYLAGDILTKVDRASMAHSLEVRVPLLDHPFLEWTARIPSPLKLHGREGKYIFKKALEPQLPHDILYRSKMGFAVPLVSWFRGPLRERVRSALTGRALAETGMFDMARLAQLVDQHQSGVSDHSAVLWSLLMFESFLRQVHFAQPRRDAPVGPAVAAS
jgi:asparagine synthase (glutamine-hydrolysing)